MSFHGAIRCCDFGGANSRSKDAVALLGLGPTGRFSGSSSGRDWRFGSVGVVEGAARRVAAGSALGFRGRVMAIVRERSHDFRPPLATG